MALTVNGYCLFFFAFFKNYLTLYLLPRVISEKMSFLRKYRPHVLWNMQLVNEYFIYAKKLAKEDW